MSRRETTPKLLKILVSPKDDAILRRKLESFPVLHGDSRREQASLQRLTDFGQRMLATMYAAKGLGLAAPQVGLEERLVVMDLGWARRTGTARREPQIWLEPSWTEKSSMKASGDEGCLSEPGVRGVVVRCTDIVATGFDLLHGGPRSVEMTGLEARCFQHEVDHLDGVLLSDRMIRR